MERVLIFALRFPCRGYREDASLSRRGKGRARFGCLRCPKADSALLSHLGFCVSLGVWPSSELPVAQRPPRPLASRRAPMPLPSGLSPRWLAGTPIPLSTGMGRATLCSGFSPPSPSRRDRKGRVCVALWVPLGSWAYSRVTPAAGAVKVPVEAPAVGVMPLATVKPPWQLLAGGRKPPLFVPQPDRPSPRTPLRPVSRGQRR
jgi:hypothetical protein